MRPRVVNGQIYLTTTSQLSMLACQMSYMSWCFDYKLSKTRLQGVTNLVSSFLELNNGFALHQLAIESRREMKI